MRYSSTTHFPKLYPQFYQLLRAPRLQPITLHPYTNAALTPWLRGHEAGKTHRKRPQAIIGRRRAAIVPLGPTGERAQHGQRNNSRSSPDVIPFARSAQSAQGDNDELDKAGQTILQLLSKAADVAEGTAGTPWIWRRSCRASSGRPRNGLQNVEAEVAAHGEKADRAEQWLHKVYTEIEDRFLDRDKNVAYVRSD